MSAVDIVVLVMIILLLLSVAYSLSLRDIIKRLKSANQYETKQKSNSINVLYDQIDSMTIKLDNKQSRIDELERGIETGFGVKVRQEITKVIADFTKLEMVIMLAGVQKLSKQPSVTISDLEIYIELLKKIQGFINDMEEETEEQILNG